MKRASDDLGPASLSACRSKSDNDRIETMAPTYLGATIRFNGNVSYHISDTQCHSSERIEYRIGHAVLSIQCMQS